MPPREQVLASAALRVQLLSECLARTPIGGVVALFAAHLGEPDVLALAQALQVAQRSAALPVVQGKALPLRFARWGWGDALVNDAYGIAAPAEHHWVRPDCVVLPCVGFTVKRGRFYRLGYGGGFYDRTLAQLRAQNAGVRALGVAYSRSRCEFEPAAHDAALDAVLCA